MVASLPTTEFSFHRSSLPIETVTVYRPSGAQVVRKLDVDLKAGNNLIVVNDLTNIADHESFSVDGLGNARLLIVQCALDRYREIQTSDPIRDLRSQIRDLQTERNAREQEVAILKAFGRGMAQNPDLTPDQAKTFSDTLFDKVLACAETVRDIDEKTLQLNLEINKIQNTIFGALFTRAVITIVADEDGPVQLRLTYRVLRARWDPLYDLHATSEDGKPSTSVSLHYLVNLWQRTGEDWTDVKLILSTSATDVLNAGIPEPDSLIIRPPTPPPMVGYSPTSPGYSPTTPMCSMAIAECEAEVDEDEEEEEDMCFDLCEEESAPQTPVVPLPQLVQSAATISKSPMTVSYTVDALTTIPSDGVSYKVLVATVPFEAVITHVTTPRRSPIAYLQCAVKNTSDYYLLPGTMSIFLNNTYVSKTDISDIATGDSFDCTLGMDTSIRVSHELTESSVTSIPSSFVEQYTTTTYVSTTKLQNRHTGDYPVDIVERSSIPIASVNDPRIKVFLKGPTGLAGSEEGGEVDLGREDGFKVMWGRDVEDTKDGQKEGKFIWFGTISPGEEVVLVSEWDVRAPFDAGWIVKSE